MAFLNYKQVRYVIVNIYVIIYGIILICRYNLVLILVYYLKNILPYVYIWNYQ